MAYETENAMLFGNFPDNVEECPDEAYDRERQQRIDDANLRAARELHETIREIGTFAMCRRQAD